MNVVSLRRVAADNGVRDDQPSFDIKEKTVTSEDLRRVERAAVALYRLDHPAYLLHTFEAVPLLETVLEYRRRAFAALRAADSKED